MGIEMPLKSGLLIWVNCVGGTPLGNFFLPPPLFIWPMYPPQIWTIPWWAQMIYPPPPPYRHTHFRPCRGSKNPKKWGNRLKKLRLSTKSRDFLFQNGCDKRCDFWPKILRLFTPSTWPPWKPCCGSKKFFRKLFLFRTYCAGRRWKGKR